MIVQNYKQTMLLLFLYMYTIPLSGIDTILQVPYNDTKTYRIGFFAPVFENPMMAFGFDHTAGSLSTALEKYLGKSENLTDYNFT